MEVVRGEGLVWGGAELLECVGGESLCALGSVCSVCGRLKGPALVLLLGLVSGNVVLLVSLESALASAEAFCAFWTLSRCSRADRGCVGGSKARGEPVVKSSASVCALVLQRAAGSRARPRSCLSKGSWVGRFGFGWIVRFGWFGAAEVERAVLRLMAV